VREDWLKFTMGARTSLAICNRLQSLLELTNEEDESGSACGTHGKDEKCLNKLDQKTLMEGSGHLVDLDINIKKNYKESEGNRIGVFVDCFSRDQNCVQWQPLVTTTLNLRVSKKIGNIL
jgi:hypothetical protein